MRNLWAKLKAKLAAVPWAALVDKASKAIVEALLKAMEEQRKKKPPPPPTRPSQTL